MRVYELAKKLNITGKDILVVCKKIGLEAKNTFSGLTETEEANIMAALGKTGAKGVKPSAAAPLEQKKSAPPKIERKQAARPAQKKPARSTGKVAPPRPAPKKAARPVRKKPARPEKKKPERPEQKKPVQPDAEPSSVRERLAKSAKPEAKAAPARPGAGTAKGSEQKAKTREAEAHQRRSRHRTTWERPEYEAPKIPAHAMRGGSFIQASPISRPARRTFRRKRSGKRFRRLPGVAQTQRKTEFAVETPISVKNLSAAIGVKANSIIFKLMQLGSMVNINAVLDADQVAVLAEELGLTIHTRAVVTAEQVVEKVEREVDRPEDLELRAPVVTFLGHVDHGKTSLLDRIRKSDVVVHEHGGITQHIGAYRVSLGDKTVVFLDTPGHEAFTAMRARGANVTDIATLVVAADDGVMPQTEEAIDHAKAADVPIVVAINKCDKPEANPMRVKQQLSALDLQPEEWGGETVCVEVSALTGQGVDDLVEMLALVAELRELKASPKRPARGTVLEAEMSESLGPVATVLMQDGTVCVGQVAVAGTSYGRVKALIDDRGHSIKEAGPSWPVSMVGLNDLPDAGDRMVVLDDIQKARAVAEERRHKQREESVAQRQHVSLENLFASIEEGRVRELRLILKADVSGTLEALSQVIGRITSEEVKTRILRASVGGVTTSDVLLGDASDAIIVGLNTGVDGAARTLADEKGVSIRVYNVIYQVSEEIERALTGMLSPEEKEVIVGHAEVRRVFKISRYGNVAGCFVADGTVARNHRVRLVRDGAVIHEGSLASLRREKADVREVREGFECGILLDGYSDVKVGDVIETFRIEMIARTLDGSGGSQSSS